MARDYATHCCVEPVYQNGVKLRGLARPQLTRNIINNVLIPALGPRLLTSITFPELLALRDARLVAPKRHGGSKITEGSGPRSIATVNREMAVLVCIFSRAVEMNLIAKSPTRARRGNSIVQLKAETPRTRVLSAKEQAAMLKVYAARTREAFILALHTGMRQGELLKLDAEYCDFEAGVLRLPWEITKAKKGRIIAMSPTVRTILEPRAAHGGLILADMSLWQILDDFAAAKRAAHIKDFQWRDCRATIATRLLQAGLSEAEIAQMTGHVFSHPVADRPAEGAKILRKHYLRLDGQAIERAAKAIEVN
jgi:integrase